MNPGLVSVLRMKLMTEFHIEIFHLKEKQNLTFFYEENHG